MHVTTDDGARLAVEVHGPAEAAATVVLVHGWTLTRASWRPVVERIARRRPDVRAVTYDQRDHGDSRPPPRLPGGRRERRPAASLARLADDLAAVVDAVAPQGPVVLGGHSMGGMTVLALAGRRPELVSGRVAGVLLANTAVAGLERRRSLTLAMRALGAAPAGVRVPRVPRFAARRLGYGAGAPRDVVARVRRGVRPPTARSVGTWYLALMDVDERESLRRLADVPVVVLAGETDRLIPSRHAVDVVEALPGARLEIVPGTGHMLLFEAPDVVAARLLDLLPLA